VPSGTPAEIVKEVGQQVRQIVALPEIQSKIYEMGFEPVGSTEAEFEQALNADLEKWRKIVKDGNIRLE
jgi:tripartite-type tricarboxylate transporter receptor subunit TctC